MKRLITPKLEKGIPAQVSEACRAGARLAQPLLVKTHEVCSMLGGIHPRTLARMEKAGLIRSVKLLRHKLYAIDDVETLVANLRAWNQELTR